MDCLEHQKTYYSNSLISKAPVQRIKISGDESAFFFSPPLTLTEVFQRRPKGENLGQQQQKEQHKEPWRNFLKSEPRVFTAQQRLPAIAATRRLCSH